MRITKTAAIAIAAIGAGHAWGNLVINPTFDSSITGNANAVQIEATINQMCAMYNAKFTDNITVNITYHNTTSGLGSNNPATITETYTDFRNALAADSSTADDATALAHLGAGATNPVTGTSTVVLTRPNARALGFSTPSGSDDTVNLNCSICNLTHGVNANPNFYDLYAVACHETDECLGTPCGLDLTNTAWAADMFRYNGSGARTFTTNTSTHAFFSLDGTTNIVEYNQFQWGGGDHGDWVHHATPQVQDWSGSPGVTVDMGPSEFRLLDGIGYNFAPAPEPSTWAMFGFGSLVLLRRRKRA